MFKPTPIFLPHETKHDYEFSIGLGLNRMSYEVLSLLLRCIFVSKRQRRFVNVEASLGEPRNSPTYMIH